MTLGKALILWWRLTGSSLHPDGLRHLPPSPVLLPLQPPQVDRRHRQRAVVEEPADLLHRLSRVPPQLGRRVAQDVDAGRGQPRLPEVAAKVAVEGAAGDAPAVTALGRPQRLLGLHGRQVLAEGRQRRLDGLEGGTGQLPSALLPPLPR